MVTMVWVADKNLV